MGIRIYLCSDCCYCKPCGFIRRINKKNICAIEFKDDSKELIVYLMPYYSNKSWSINIPFSEYALEINKKVSQLGYKYLHLTIKQNGLPVGIINGNDSYWAGQKILLDKVIRKSSELGKMEEK